MLTGNSQGELWACPISLLVLRVQFRERSQVSLKSIGVRRHRKLQRYPPLTRAGSISGLTAAANAVLDGIAARSVGAVSDPSRNIARLGVLVKI
ncbi:Uncharacterised protein [Mycobacteroides abscessus subsp. abscessus]|nr:Uncharacterised protein [Mycobacteroides abscessus subsp. abscessus]